MVSSPYLSTAEYPGYKHVFVSVRAVSPFVSAVVACYEKCRVCQSTQTFDFCDDSSQADVGMRYGRQVFFAHPAKLMRTLVGPTEVDEQEIQVAPLQGCCGGFGDTDIAQSGHRIAVHDRDIKFAGIGKIAKLFPVEHETGLKASVMRDIQNAWYGADKRLEYICGNSVPGRVDTAKHRHMARKCT